MIGVLPNYVTLTLKRQLIMVTLTSNKTCISCCIALQLNKRNTGTDSKARKTALGNRH
jgi:hypothetical protein